MNRSWARLSRTHCKEIERSAGFIVPGKDIDIFDPGTLVEDLMCNNFQFRAVLQDHGFKTRASPGLITEACC